MKNTVKLKTNVKCAACVASIKPAMDQLPADCWEVDLQSPDRILTVQGDVEEETIKMALEKSGYKGETI
ncbi:Heavy-metal-associated domain-containing protein [Cyclobacterium lianum]|uniref:Heavy-metal-associated domain-containing protein n=1 Tax=Cyclobacterium lianum TaxID=388280 RepID=A0A1M7IF61_9BACT|nr:cation transporter [Cyclobacterium lianum]SHM39077.1 Heavy-metal-associated domain-containing protein [Cyclobacterium lianum]